MKEENTILSTDIQDAEYFEESYLQVNGARVHNLQNIDVEIPRNQLVVITGLSGSGKSSLAFDTIYAEGQRRYMETFSAYARHFLGNLERPDVDHISGLSPVISIEQKTTGKNPRSTVGTVTEIYDFLRLLYARVADAYSRETGKRMVKYTDEQIIDLIVSNFNAKNILILAPMVVGRKGHYRELFEQLRRQGYIKVRLDGNIVEIGYKMQADRYKVHDIEVVVDQLKAQESSKARIARSVQTAMKLGRGSILIVSTEDKLHKHYSRLLMCEDTGISYPEPEPNTFSFNSPYGACPRCSGLGNITEIDMSRIIPDERITLRNGGLAPLGPYKNNWAFRMIEAIGARYGFTLDSAIEDIPEQVLNIILYGSSEVFQIKNESLGSSYSMTFEGIINFMNNQDEETASASVKKWISSFSNRIVCPDCKGTRLKEDALWFKIGNKSIAQLAEMDLLELQAWFKEINTVLNQRQQVIASEIVREIQSRLGFLLNVGIDYLSLNRPARSLSGGESQRIRLATQIGSQLVGVLYILDEPSIGLHQRDNHRLIDSLKELRDLGNSVIVVEHDEEMIRSADYIIDIGPGAGKLGGKVVAAGKPEEMTACNTITCEYLSGKKQISLPEKRRTGNGNFIGIKGAKGNNLKNLNVDIPLGTFTCVTGVSGSGKSTLINETLYPVLSQHFYNSAKQALEYSDITGIEHIDKIIEIDQSPIGRTPRSNPATYTGVFGDIRNLFAILPESKIRAYQPGRFSFNVKGGRCETCQGAGIRVIEMNFLPDVNVVCETCNGMRYNRETLEVRYRGKSINDVLNLTINQAVDFFENIPSIVRKIKTLKEVGLGYISLGQQSTTLSGGEAQRVKLATELSKKDTGKTLYILDEPTTGLHFEDVRVLLSVLNRLVDKGNTVVVIEHNLDVIKVADYIIELGPDGGNKGGNIVFTGTPEQLAISEKSYTSAYLDKILNTKKTHL